MSNLEIVELLEEAARDGCTSLRATEIVRSFIPKEIKIKRGREVTDLIWSVFFDAFATNRKALPTLIFFFNRAINGGDTQQSTRNARAS